MGKLFVLMGKSSTGKDTIYKELLHNERLQLKEVVLYTTRPIRNGETKGKEYHFVDEKTRDELADSGKIIERRDYNTVHGIWSYFTVDDGQFDLENNDYLVIATLEAYKEFIKFFGKDNVKPIYIEVEDGLRLTRALEREKQQKTPKYAELCRRYLADTADFSQEKLKEAGINIVFENVSLVSCLEEIVNYVLS